jgi:hypothetical protein
MSRAHPLATRADLFLHELLGPWRPAAHEVPWRLLVATVLVAGPLYGAVMGSYAFHSAERLLMVLYAAIKMPVLIGVTGLLCLPGFFVLTTVLGLRDDFRASLRAILTSQAAMVLVLLSLAPITRFIYISGVVHRDAILANALMFAVAAAAAQVVLWRLYRPLIRRDRRHLATLWSWLLLYAFVGIQMGWMLRPFIGTPDIAVTFFREEPFSNAYVVIFELLTHRR